jgi:hypothetical protein
MASILLREATMATNQSTVKDGVTGHRAPVTRAEVEAFKQWIADHPGEPVTEIPGLDPAEIWEALREVEAGLSISHEEMLEKLRRRQ